MTITEFLNRVPWSEMGVGYSGVIRRREPEGYWYMCPLAVAFNDSHTYYVTAVRAGLSGIDAIKVMEAADHMWRQPILRMRMLYRIWKARGK